MKCPSLSEMDEPKIESGLQLFSRVNESHNSKPIKLPLFPDGIYPKESIEITGRCSVGKTFVLLDFVINCVIPEEFKNVKLPGNNIEVVLINTDHQFNIGHLVNLIEDKLKQYLKVSLSSLVEDCLKKIIILNCYNSNQLKFTFLNLEYILQENKQIRMVAVDSLCSYYWMDRAGLEYVSFNSYCSTLRNALINIINDFNVVVLYTKVQIDTQSQSNPVKNYYSIHLTKEDTHYEAVVSKQEERLLTIKYTLNPFVTFL